MGTHIGGNGSIFDPPLSSHTQGSDMPTERPDGPLQPSDASKSGATEEDAIDSILEHARKADRFVQQRELIIGEAKAAIQSLLAEARKDTLIWATGAKLTPSDLAIFQAMIDKYTAAAQGGIAKYE